MFFQPWQCMLGHHGTTGGSHVLKHTWKDSPVDDLEEVDEGGIFSSVLSALATGKHTAKLCVSAHMFLYSWPFCPHYRV